MSKNLSKLVINGKIADRYLAFENLSASMKQYSERVAHNSLLLFLKLLNKKVYTDYQDLNINNAKYIFDIVRFFDVGYAFEGGENIYSGTAIPMQHVELGSEVFYSDVRLREDFKKLSREELLIRRLGKEVSYYHHERWDGHGYPEGLRMEETPLLARICAIALAFEQHTYSNSQKLRATKEEALKLIAEEKERAFDPILVDAFLELKDKLVIYGETFEKYDEAKCLESVKSKAKPKKEAKVKEKPVRKIVRPTKSRKKKHKPIEMLYAPIVDIKTDKVVYYQTELVIYDKSLGELHPLVYSSMAEKTGQIVELTLLGFTQVLNTLEKIIKNIDKFERVCIKIYRTHIIKPNFIKRISQLFSKYHVSPDKFIFEIPESALIGASDVVLENLDDIRKLGIKIAIVEFGIGYSSIDTLCKIDFDFVTIDKKFTKNLLIDTKVSGVVRGLLDFVKRLGAESICEGVNSEEEKQKLQKFGCKKIQGKLAGEQLTEEQLVAKYKK